MKLKKNLLSIQIGLLLFSTSASSQSFTISSGQTQTTSQTLFSNDTATIQEGGALEVSDTGNVTAIFSNENNVSVFNAGDIKVNSTGGNVEAIFTQGDNAYLHNSGRIQASGPGSIRGIWTERAGTTVLNSGLIEVSSFSFADSAGIRHGGTDSVSITNTGALLVTGQYGKGISASGNNTTINNQGLINVSGEFAVGVDAYDNTTINNSGRILVYGQSAKSVAGGSGSQTLNLYKGSQIIGLIDMGDGNDTVNVYGGVGSSVLTFVNTEQINLHIDNAVRVNNTVIVIDPTVDTVTANILNNLTTGAHRLINDQSDRSLDAIRLGATAKTLQIATTQESIDAHRPWGQLYGSKSKQESNKNLQTYEHTTKGFLFGQAWNSLPYENGWVAGFSKNRTASSAHDRHTDSFLLGAYRTHAADQWVWKGSVLFGLENHNNQRRVLDASIGEQSAHGRFTSAFVSPSVSVGRIFYDDSSLQVRPSASLTYSFARYGKYTESGTTSSNLSVDARHVHALASQLEVDVRKFIDGKTVNLRAGVQTRNTFSEALSAQVLGQSFAFSTDAGNQSFGAHIGLGINFRLSNQLNFFVDLEAVRMRDKETLSRAQVNLAYWF